jgi:hypothetical protein
MKGIVGILFILTSVMCVFSLCSCTQCAYLGADKPQILWTNYDLDNGLGAPSYGSGKGFEPLPIADGVLCNDIGLSSRDGSEVLWVCTDGPLMCSEDGGSSWQVIEESLVSFQGPGLIRVDIWNGIWLATRCGVHHSADGGASWSDVWSHPLWCSGINDMEIDGAVLWVAASEVCQLVRVDIASEASEVTFAGTELIEQVLPASDGSLYISTASGIFRSKPQEKGRVFEHFYGSGVHQNFVEVDGTIWCTDLVGNVKQISATGTLLWQSVLELRVLKPAPTGGVIWGLGKNGNGAILARIDTRNSYHVEITELGVSTTRALYIDPEGTIYISLPGEVAYSSNGGDLWTHRIIGISTVHVITAKEGHAWAKVSGVGASRFLASQEQWETVSARSFASIEAIYMRSPSEIFLSCAYDPLIGRTTDGGETFTTSTFDVSPATCQSICEDSSGRVYLCCNQATQDHLQYWINLYYSDTDGQSWSAPEIVYHGPSFPHWPKLVVDEIRRVLWVTCGLGLYRRSLDGGPWQTEQEFGYTESPFLSAGGIIYVIGYGPQGWGLYFLEVGGTAWSHRMMPDSNKYDTSLVVDPDGDLWFGVNTGVHYSSDVGSSWATYTKADGLASTYVYSISVDGSGDSRVLWVGTALGASRGIIVPP